MQADEKNKDPDYYGNSYSTVIILPHSRKEYVKISYIYLSISIYLIYDIIWYDNDKLRMSYATARCNFVGT